jgi:Leucine Rich repeat
MSHLPTLCSLLLGLVHATTVLHAAPPPELILLQQTYDKAVAERVTAPFDTALAALNAKYLPALDGAANAAKAAGKLDDLLAIEGDKTATMSKQPPPDADDEKTPEALKKLRAIYRQQFTKLVGTRTVSHEAILPAYLERLKTLEVTLTKASRVDEAKAVMTYRELVSTGLPTAPTQLATSSATTPSTAPTGLSAEALAGLPKGDDRKAAEWLLSIRANVTLADKGKEVKPAEEKDIPKGSPKITYIGINSEGGGVQQFPPEALDKLSHLDELWKFHLNLAGLEFSAEGLRFLATCPNLREVTFMYIKPDPVFFDYLIPAKQLKGFAFFYAETGHLDFARLQTKQLEWIDLSRSNVEDSTVQTFAAHPTLMSISLNESGRVTDAAMAPLVDLKKLSSLHVANTKVTLTGLRPLAGLKLSYMSFGSKEPSDYRELGAMFPLLNTFTFARYGSVPDAALAAAAASMPNLERLFFLDGKLTDANCAALGGFAKLKYLDLTRTDLTDEAVPALLQLSKLQTLNLFGTQLTDAGLLQLKALRSLKKIILSKDTISEAAAAAFKKSRSDVQIER